MKDWLGGVSHEAALHGLVSGSLQQAVSREFFGKWGQAPAETFLDEPEPVPIFIPGGAEAWAALLASAFGDRSWRGLSRPEMAFGCRLFRRQPG